MWLHLLLNLARLLPGSKLTPEEVLLATRRILVRRTTVICILIRSHTIQVEFIMLRRQWLLHLLLLLIVLLLFFGKGFDKLVVKLIDTWQLETLARLQELLA